MRLQTTLSENWLTLDLRSIRSTKYFVLAKQSSIWYSSFPRVHESRLSDPGVRARIVVPGRDTHDTTLPWSMLTTTRWLLIVLIQMGGCLESISFQPSHPKAYLPFRVIFYRQLCKRKSRSFYEIQTVAGRESRSS